MPFCPDRLSLWQCSWLVNLSANGIMGKVEFRHSVEMLTKKFLRQSPTTGATHSPLLQSGAIYEWERESRLARRTRIRSGIGCVWYRVLNRVFHRRNDTATQRTHGHALGIGPLHRISDTGLNPSTCPQAIGDSLVEIRTIASPHSQSNISRVDVLHRLYADGMAAARVHGGSIALKEIHIGQLLDCARIARQ